MTNSDRPPAIGNAHTVLAEAQSFIMIRSNSFLSIIPLPRGTHGLRRRLDLIAKI